MIYFLCRIAKLCKEYPRIRESLIRHNLISHLLDVLVNSKNIRLQSTIINLLSILFHSRASKVELRKFFDFFVRNDHLTCHFVDGLLAIVSEFAEKMAPSFFLSFPRLSVDRQENNVSDEWVKMQLQNNNISPWTHCCLILSAFQNQPIWSTGFSTSFWIKYVPSSQAKVAKNLSVVNQMHIISFGTDTMLLELWVDETKFSFSIKLTAIRGNNVENSTFTVSAPISGSQWHLMAFSVSSEVKNDSVSLAIKVIIDGLHEDIFQTDFKKLPKNCPEKLRVLIGDHMNHPLRFQSSYCLGNLMMFQSDILSKAHCLTLTSYGPDFENFIPSSCWKANLTSSVFVPHDIDDSIFLNVLRNHEKLVEHLQEKIILSFAPREYQYFNRFSLRAGTKKNQFDTQSVELTDQHFVYNIRTTVLHPISYQRLQTFYDYILDNGGFSYISFLLAKVVEMSECKIVHANILKFVLKSLSNCYLHSQLEMHRGYDLISYVMSNARFIFSEHSLVVLLEATCHENLSWSDGNLNLPRKVRIYNPHIITTLILPHWRRWQDLLIIFFKKLCEFIHPQNSHQIFNAEILTSHGIVEKVLNFCREKFLGDNDLNENNVSQKLIEAVLDFMQFLVCLLHSEDQFRQISDFLLVMHPSSALQYQPLENGYFWSFEKSSTEKLQKRFQCHEKVDDIIGLLSITSDTNSDLCWKSDRPAVSLCSDDKMDAILMCNFNECPTCKGEDNNECIHNLDCLGSSPKKFCQKCQTIICDTIPGHNFSPPCLSNHCLLEEGLLNILHNAVTLVPDSVLNIIRRDIVNGDLLLTLINHPLASIREAVLRIVIACMSRYSYKKTDIFSENQQFYILADQLAMHPVTEEIVNGCVSLIFRRSFTFHNQLPLRPSASPPLLALLPKSVPNFPLAINILRYIKLMLRRNPHSLENLPENCLIDSLLKTIQITIHTSICEPCQEECMKVLVAECMDLFTIIVNTCLMHSALSTSKLILHEVFFKWHWLTVIEAFEWGSDGEYLRITNNLRRRLLQTALDKTLSMIKNHCSNNKAAVFAEDLMNWFKFVVHRSLEFILFPPFVVPQDEIFYFVCKLFVILIDAVSDVVAKVDSIYQQVDIFLRKQTAYLLLWILSPSKPPYVRMFALRKLHFEPNLKKILITLFQNDAESEHKFAVFVWQLTFSNSHKLSNSEMFLCEKFMQRLRHLLVLSASVLEKTEKIWFLDVQTKIREMTIVLWDRQKFYFETLAAFIKNYSKDIQNTFDAKLKNGFVLSGNIMQRLGAQNGKYMYDANVQNCIRVEVKMSWMKISEQFTHERGSWFICRRPFNLWTYVSIFLLNEAGKSSTGERRAGKKFLIQKCLQQMEFTYDKRLSYLFDENVSNANVISYIFMKDIISDTFNTIKLQYGTETDGEILIGEENFYFIPARDIFVNYDLKIPFDSIDEVIYRTYKSEDNCVEMFLSNGGPEFFYFFSQAKRNEFVAILKTHISSKRIICCCILDTFTHKWKNGGITNWEYLHTLNKLAGRSYNDFMQYPLMPLILADYSSETIDLAQSNIYRNLSKLSSVRAVSKEFKTRPQNFNLLSFSTFPSNLFSGSENNDTAISEYFDVSEIMGYIYTQKKSNKAAIKNMKLPTWAHNNYRLFALVYRQLLESHHIRKNLAHWIDLTFGFIQATDFVKKVEPSGNNHVKSCCRAKNPLFTSPHPSPLDNNQKENYYCCNIPVISGVRSIKWGNFVGSPQRNPPSVMSRKYFSLPIVAFVPLLTNSVHVVFPKTAPLFFYDYEQVLETGQKDRIAVSRMFLLNWNSNGVISVKENQVHRPIAFCPPRDPITVFSITPDYCYIWVGLSSGIILVFKLSFNNSSISTKTCPNPSVLHGHSNKITGICLSRPFGIAVSISEDESAILWDLNKMIYVRSFTGLKFPVIKLNIVAISDTLGDVVTVGYDELNRRSLLRMYTIDGVLIGSICTAERITAVCFSTAPEGISVNVIATALQNGVIRLWNTWDLSAVCEFTNSPSPITCLTYSFDAENLYAATEDGYVTIWRSSERSPTRKSCC